MYISKVKQLQHERFTGVLAFDDLSAIFLLCFKGATASRVCNFKNNTAKFSHIEQRLEDQFCG